MADKKDFNPDAIHVCGFHQGFSAKVEDLCGRVRAIEISNASGDTAIERLSNQFEQILIRLSTLEIARATEDSQIDQLTKMMAVLNTSVTTISKKIDTAMWKMIAGLASILGVFITVLFEIIKSALK